MSDDVPEPTWRNEVHSQHFACDRCGRSFERLTPHNFSFNSPLGWCPACEGLGTQTGANPAALVHDPKLTLAEGAIGFGRTLPRPADRQARRCLPRCWRRCRRRPACRPMCRSSNLRPGSGACVLYGCGEEWIEVPNPRPAEAPASAAKNRHGEGRRKSALPWFRFQYKGLYPALEEAARLSPAMRGKLDPLIDEVECSTCDGTRLRDDAAAVRLKDLTIGQIGRLPLERLARRTRWLEMDERRKENRRRTDPRNSDSRAIPCRRRPGISHAGPAGPDALRRRSPANSAGQPGGQRLVRRAICAR